MIAAMPSDDYEKDPVIVEARLDDLDLDDEADRATWEDRLRALSASRLRQARARLERMGIIDSQGRIISDERPADMLASSETSVDTG